MIFLALLKNTVGLHKCPGTPKDVQVDGSGCPIVVKNETKVIEKITQDANQKLNAKVI
jgi:OOP family OmpA-OmpF porin